MSTASQNREIIKIISNDMGSMHCAAAGLIWALLLRRIIINWRVHQQTVITERPVGTHWILCLPEANP